MSKSQYNTHGLIVPPPPTHPGDTAIRHWCESTAIIPAAISQQRSTCWQSAGSKLVQRLRRWASLDPALAKITCNSCEYSPSTRLHRSRDSCRHDATPQHRHEEILIGSPAPTCLPAREVVAILSENVASGCWRVGFSISSDPSWGERMLSGCRLRQGLHLYQTLREIRVSVIWFSWPKRNVNGKWQWLLTWKVNGYSHLLWHGTWVNIL